MELHDWEQVFVRDDAFQGIRSYMNRYKVPNGWIYIHVILQSRLFRKPKAHVNSVFVPDNKT